jgi:hypothetical protein
MINQGDEFPLTFYKEVVMEKQKRLLLIPAILGLAYGIVGLFFPSVLHGMFKMPAEHINPTLNELGAVLAISQLSLGLLANWMRKVEDIAVLNSGMKVVAVIFLLFAVEGMFNSIIFDGLRYSAVSSVQGLIFLIIAVLFYLNSKQKA